MKKIILFLFVIFSISIFAESESYRKDKLVDIDVYFPKTIAEYIDALLKNDDIESYYKLANLYAKLGKREAALIHLSEYQKFKTDNLKLSKIYHELKNYKLEIEFIEKYIKNMTLDEKKPYLDYLYKLIDENKVKDLNKDDYKLSNLQILKSKITMDQEYYNFFNANTWTLREKIILKKDLKEENLSEKPLQKEIFLKLSSENEMLEYYFNEINGLEDKTAYFEYFKIAESLKRNVHFRTEFERIYYLDYKEQTGELNTKILELIEDSFANKTYSKLYNVYKMYSDFKILYNLALENEYYLYKLIKEAQVMPLDDKYLKALSSNFIRLYPESSYLKEVKKLNFKFLENNEAKLVLINTFLTFQFDIDVFDEKLKILETLGKTEEIEKELKDLIFEKYPVEKYIRKYTELLEKSKRTQDAYINLRKLSNKFYFIEFSKKHNLNVPLDYKKELADYYFTKQEYHKLIKYKSTLNYIQYKTLIDLGKDNYKKIAARKYPFEIKWMDLNKEANFFFNSEFEDYKETYVRIIEGKEDKTDAEYYYLARYYHYISDYDTAKKALNKVFRKYRHDEDIIKFRTLLSNDSIVEEEIEEEEETAIIEENIVEVEIE